MTEESLQDEYARLLREGRTEEATEVAQEMRDDVEPGNVVETEDEEPISEQERFVELDGVGEELAEEMVEEFGSYKGFVEEADVDSLSDISGIGESRAESLLEQKEE